MRPKTKFQGVKLVVRKKSFVFPFLAGAILAGLGSAVLLGRATVVDTGKSIGNVSVFSVDNNYVPSGIMGDTADVKPVDKQTGFVRFVYEAEGGEPHEWDLKYIGGKENHRAAEFGGVMYLNPKNNWGKDSNGGFDLRGCHRVIKWEARSAGAPVNVEFLIGGANWQWDPKTNERANVPYPDTVEMSLGTQALDSQWREFSAPLSSVPDDNFKRVVAGFGWMITWGSNGIKPNKDQTRAEQPKSFTIEIRNVRYEK